MQLFRPCSASDLEASSLEGVPALLPGFREIEFLSRDLSVAGPPCLPTWGRIGLIASSYLKGVSLSWFVLARGVMLFILYLMLSLYPQVLCPGWVEENKLNFCLGFGELMAITRGESKAFIDSVLLESCFFSSMVVELNFFKDSPLFFLLIFSRRRAQSSYLKSSFRGEVSSMLVSFFLSSIYKLVALFSSISDPLLGSSLASLKTVCLFSPLGNETVALVFSSATSCSRPLILSMSTLVTSSRLSLCSLLSLSIISLVCSYMWLQFLSSPLTQTFILMTQSSVTLYSILKSCFSGWAYLLGSLFSLDTRLLLSEELSYLRSVLRLRVGVKWPLCWRYRLEESLWPPLASILRHSMHFCQCRHNKNIKYHSQVMGAESQSFRHWAALAMRCNRVDRLTVLLTFWYYSMHTWAFLFIYQLFSIVSTVSMSQVRWIALRVCSLTWPGGFQRGRRGSVSPMNLRHYCWSLSVGHDRIVPWLLWVFQMNELGLSF